MRLFVLILLGAVLTLVSRESVSSNDPVRAQSWEQHKPHAHQKTRFVKPGAAVTLSHDYDGKTELGELETVSAKLSHLYQAGVLSVALLSAPDIQISAFTSLQNKTIYQGVTLDLPIQFSSLSQGRFTLSLETVYTSPEGQESRRVLSIPVNVGGEKIEKMPNLSRTKHKTNTESGLVGLAAIEVIQ